MLKHHRRQISVALSMLVLCGCAGMTRSCSSFGASSFGADWVIAQFDYNGQPFNCWKLTNVSVTNEPQSDGVYWLDNNTGNLVHISGWYNRVQVAGGDYSKAANLVGVDIAKCGDGRYPAS